MSDVQVRVSDAGLSRRIAAVDVVRGLIMIVMALDHTRDYFSNATVDPTDPVHSWPVLFFTRWITHLCAPGFVAVAGTITCCIFICCICWRWGR